MSIPNYQSMPSSSNITHPLAILEDINARHIPSHQERGYDELKTKDSLPSSEALKMINSLEIEEFIPAKAAILLKLNWADVDFSQAILCNIVANLRDTRGLISENLANFILGEIDRYQNQKALELIYACMRLESRHDVYTLDDITLSSHSEVMKHVYDKEYLHSRLFLDTYTTELSKRFEEEKPTLNTMQVSIENNAAKAFHDSYLSFLSNIASKETDPLHRICFEEIKETLEALKPDSTSFFVDVYRILKTHELYGRHLIKVVDLTDSLKSPEIEKDKNLEQLCFIAFKNSMYFLADYKNMSCGSMTLYALQHGLIKKEWLKISRIFASHKHRFCDCHAVDQSMGRLEGTTHEGLLRMWPLQHKPFASICKNPKRQEDSCETVAVYGCQWGSGHKQTTINASEILEQEGMHPVTIDMPGELYLEEGQQDSTTVIFNKLLQHRAFSIINMLRWATGSDNVKPIPSEQIRTNLRRMLLVNPSAAVLTIGSLAEPLVKAAEIMGIPCLQIATDRCRTVYTRSAPLEYPHFKMSIPYPEEFMIPTVSNTETKEQITLGGPPVKKAYDIERNAQDINGLKRDLDSSIQLNIPPGKKLIIVANGSNGASSPYPDYIIEKFKGKSKEEIPFVLAVLCGHNNDSYKSYVEKQAANLPQGVVKALGFVQPENMEKLYRVASYGGGLIGKAGGLTLFETSKCGTRMIIDNMPSPIFGRGWEGLFLGIFNWICRLFGFQNFLYWEKDNQDFATSQGFGTAVSSVDEFYAAFDDLLSHSKPAQLAATVESFSRRLPDIVNEMKASIAEDETYRQRRIYLEDPKAAARIL